MSLILFILYTLFVMFVSLMPAGGEPSVVQANDKLVHMIIYGVFVFLAIPLTNTKQKLLYLCLAIAFFGVLMEIGQNLSPGRVMSSDDIIANLLGVILVGTYGMIKK